MILMEEVETPRCLKCSTLNTKIIEVTRALSIMDYNMRPPDVTAYQWTKEPRIALG